MHNRKLFNRKSLVSCGKQKASGSHVKYRITAVSIPVNLSCSISQISILIDHYRGVGSYFSILKNQVFFLLRYLKQGNRTCTSHIEIGFFPHICIIILTNIQCLKHCLVIYYKYCASCKLCYTSTYLIYRITHPDSTFGKCQILHFLYVFDVYCARIKNIAAGSNQFISLQNTIIDNRRPSSCCIGFLHINCSCCEYTISIH